MGKLIMLMFYPKHIQLRYSILIIVRLKINISLFINIDSLRCFNVFSLYFGVSSRYIIKHLNTFEVCVRKFIMCTAGLCGTSGVYRPSWLCAMKSLYCALFFLKLYIYI